MTFKYRHQRRHITDLSLGPVIQRTGSEEVLSGQIEGRKASDLEERFYRSLQTMKIPSNFRVRISSLVQGQRRLTTEMANLPGELEIDFLIDVGQITPVMIDGQISHFMTPTQRLQDEEKTSLVDDFGQGMGWHKTIRVPFTEMKKQYLVDDIVRKIYNGSYVPQFVQ